MSKPTYHIHHIIPRHAGGTDEPSNLVALTIEEHAEAHRQLWLQYGRLEDKYAWLGLAGLTDEASAAGQELANRKKAAPEFREKMTRIRTEQWASSDYRENMMSIRSSDEYREKCRVAAARRSTAEYKEKCRAATTAKWADETHREQRIQSIRAARAKQSAGVKAKWRDPVWREKMLAARRKP